MHWCANKYSHTSSGQTATSSWGWEKMTGAGQLLHWRGQETTQRLHRSQKALQTNTVIISPKEEKPESRVIRKCLQCSGQGKDPLLPFLSGTSLNSAGISPPQPWWSFPVTQNLFPEDHLTPHTKKTASPRCLSSYLVAGETQIQRGSCISYELCVTELSGQSSGLGSRKLRFYLSGHVDSLCDQW